MKDTMVSRAKAVAKWMWWWWNEYLLRSNNCCSWIEGGADELD